MHCTRFSGAPARRAASLTISTVRRMLFFALGCGLMTMAFPAFREMMLLYRTVEVGFVEGISAATTPMGTATSKIPAAGSSRMMPTVFISLIES